MKLELKHLVGYLPYSLKFYLEQFDGTPNKPWTLTINSVEFALENQNKPILRPLSDLRKEEFNYLYTLLRVHIGKNKRDKLINECYGITDLPYFIFEQLLENHFDLFNLIKKELAIDVNTL